MLCSFVIHRVGGKLKSNSRFIYNSLALMMKQKLLQNKLDIKHDNTHVLIYTTKQHITQHPYTYKISFVFSPDMSFSVLCLQIRTKELQPHLTSAHSFVTICHFVFAKHLIYKSACVMKTNSVYIKTFAVENKFECRKQNKSILHQG